MNRYDHRVTFAVAGTQYRVTCKACGELARFQNLENARIQGQAHEREQAGKAVRAW